jgi:hypothetical protein
MNLNLQTSLRLWRCGDTSEWVIYPFVKEVSVANNIVAKRRETKDMVLLDFPIKGDIVMSDEEYRGGGYVPPSERLIKITNGNRNIFFLAVPDRQCLHGRLLSVEPYDESSIIIWGENSIMVVTESSQIEVKYLEERLDYIYNESIDDDENVLTITFYRVIINENGEQTTIERKSFEVVY